MCCSIKCCRIFLAVVSVIILVVGIVVCVFSGIIKNESIFDSNDELRIAGNYIFYIILALGLLVAIFGLCGFCMIKCHKRCCNCCYGCWILICSFIFGGVGIFLFYIGNSVCSKSDGDYLFILNSISNTLKTVDNEINEWSAEKFCTSECPCSLTMPLWQWNEDRLNEFYRTKQISFKKNYQTYTTLNVVSGGYKSFYQCLDYQLSRDSKYQLSHFTLTLLKEIENMFDCNGICNPGIFYFYKELKEGPPTKSCMDSLRQTFKNITVNVGITLIVSFVFCVIAFISQYWLCRSIPKANQHHQQASMQDESKEEFRNKHMPVNTAGYQNIMPNQVINYGPEGPTPSYFYGATPNYQNLDNQMNQENNQSMNQNNSYGVSKQI
ncbi:tetraspanin family protein [Stylonychia lemnae]|uniref:Tetraspanin family protein n=1 Tax=Stylonychia lemnae TaxID=5949 RepID=A0A078A3U5_STYLE|nr:tetraspanin family protein [Stylonychia lemnae]|eukprot:CDW76928.1 tetraspanin family protein [Stylonychia lemnae]